MKGISIKAIALAFVAMLALDLVSGVVLMVSYGQGLLNPDMDEQQMQEAVKAMTRLPGFLVWSLLLGTLSTVAGGYLAARLATAVPYWNALAFGMVSLLFGVFMSGDLPLWYSVLGFGLTVPAALSGAYFFKQSAAAKPPVMPVQ